MKLFLIFFGLLATSTTTTAQCWQKIASRYDHVLAIHVDGTLWNWGGTTGTQRSLTTPTLLNTDNWNEIATGKSFQAAIKSDGTLWMWGLNSYGQLGQGTTTNVWTMAQVGTDSDWSKVACGSDHTVALKTDGTLWIWGRNNYGQLGLGTNRTNSSTPTQLGTDTDWTEISGGEWHSLAKKTNNSVWFVGACYGTQVSSLHLVGGTSQWKTMAAGAYTDYGIKMDGTLWTWGQNNGNYTNLTQMGTASNWSKVSTSHKTHALLINTSGDLWSVGYNTYGQLGDGTVNYATLPVLISNSNDWSQVVAGNYYSLALKTNQSFWGWGHNTHCQFGNGKNKDVLQPVVSAIGWEMATSSTASYNSHTLAIKENGSLWGWGTNNDGQLGDYTSINHVIPNQVGTDTTWATVSNGFHFSIGIKDDGSLWGWGRNSRGQLGLGSGIGTKITPTRVGTDTTWMKVACGSEFVLALKTDSTLWAWGYNFNGPIGNGTSGATATVFTPIQIGVDTTWADIAAGYEHSLALKADSTLWSWGYDLYGQLGRAGSNYTPAQVGSNKWFEIACGGFHSLAIRADSTLWAFGRNLYGQLGDNSTSNRVAPTSIAPSKKWSNIEGGYEHSVAIDDQDSLWGWGRNSVGQLGDSASYVTASSVYAPTKSNSNASYKALGAGGVNSIAIQTDGTLQTYGDGFVPDYNMNFTQLGYLTLTPTQWNSCNYCPPSSFSYGDTICAGDSLLFAGSYRSTTGTYQQTLTNSNGCDSLLTLNLTVGTPIFGTDLQSTCDSFLWIDGVTYTASTTAPTFVLTSASGCDSTVSLDLTILNSSTSNDIQTACESYTWLDGNTYTSSNNSATHLLTNAAGCDSVITLNLTILNSTSSTDTQTACGSFTWLDGNTYTSSNNSATHLLTNAAGCDSTVTLDLTIVSLDPSVLENDPILTATETGVSYQWIDCSNNFTPIAGETNATFQATVNGNYAVAIDNGMCVDTSNCIAIVTVNFAALSLESGLILYPNPTKDGIFHVKIEGSIQKIEVIDVLGRTLALPTYLSEAKVDGSELASGTYLVTVIAHDGRQLLGKLQVQR